MSERPDTSTTTTPANDDMSLAVSHVPTNIDMTPVSSHTHIDIPNVGTVGLPQELADDHSAIAQKIHNAISSVPRPSVNMEPVVTPSDFNPFAEVGEGVKQVGNLLEAGQEKTEREGGFADIPIYSSVPGSAAMQKQGNISGDFLNKSYKNISVPLAKAGNDFVGSLETPSNFALMGGLSAIPAATETGKALHTAINSYFAGNMSIAGVQNAFEAYKQAMKGNVPEAVQQAANTFLNLAFAAESGKGASETYKAAKEQVSERVKKQVADQQEQKFLEELKQKRANPISVQIPGVKEPIIVPEDKAEAIAKVIHDHVNGLTPEGANISNEELARAQRGEKYFTISKGGNLTAQLSQPDAASDLKGGAVVKVLPDGTYDVQRGDPSVAEKYKDRVMAAVQPSNKAVVPKPVVPKETPTTVGSAAVAKSDNELFQQAKQELGPNASISQIALRAQELKTQAQKAGTAPTYTTPNRIQLNSALEEIDSKFEKNPDNPNEYMLKAAGKPGAFFDVTERDGRIRLKTIRSVEPKSGIGSVALDRILKVADKHGVPVELTATPYGPETGRIGGDELKNWYRKHGFVDEPGFDPALGYMIREPKTPTYGSQNKVITTDQYNEAKKTLGDALSGLATGEAGTAQAKFDPKALKAAANIGMYHLEAGARNFKDWSETMIADLGKDIKPYLNDMWDNMSKKHWPTMAIASHENTGGSTFNAVTGKNLIGSNTYTLGTEPGRTQVINRPLTEQDLKDFANKNADKVKKDSDHYAVSSWKDENGVTHLDVSQKFKSEKEAQQVGRENRQLAMYHLGGKGEVPINYPVTEAIKKDYGVDNNNTAQTGFITVNGDFVPIGYDLHDVAVMRGIDKSGVKGGPKELKGSDAHEWFMNQEGAVRLRLRRSPAGWELAISAPDKLRPEQVDRIKQAITKMGPNPNIYVERLPDPKNKDLVPDYRRVEQAKPDDAEKALRELGVYESTKPIEENSKSESPLNATAEALGGKKAVDPISLLRPEEKARLTPSAQNKLRAEFRRLQGSIPEQAAAFTKSAAEAAKEKVAKMREENTSFDFGANVEETLGGKKKNK